MLIPFNRTLLVILIAGMLALVGGTYFILDRLTIDRLPESPGSKKPQDTTFAEPPPTDERAIFYTDNGFSIQSITIKASDQIGCIIGVVNRTDKPLYVGVSPHNEAGDPGVRYRDIAPGETGFMDPRYTNLDGIDMHNHAKPEHSFHVTFGESCK